MAKSTKVKIVLVGDGFVGKTSLISAYTSGSFSRMYMPTVADNCTSEISVDDKPIRLSIHDTAGQEDYDRLRPLSYKDTNVFLVCYSIDSPASFDNVSSKWLPELRHYVGTSVPMVLVATKLDLRGHGPTEEDIKLQHNRGTISTVEGKRLAETISASKFFECSALTQEGLDSVFREAVRAHFAVLDQSGKKTKRSGCSML